MANESQATIKGKIIPDGVNLFLDSGEVFTGWQNLNISKNLDSIANSFSFTYDFEDGDTYTQTFSMDTSTAKYGSAVFGTDVYAGSGGQVTRRDLIGRGRVVKFKFANSSLDEEFQIDVLGHLAHLETNG